MFSWPTSNFLGFQKSLRKAIILVIVSTYLSICNCAVVTVEEGFNLGGNDGGRIIGNGNGSFVELPIISSEKNGSNIGYTDMKNTPVGDVSSTSTPTPPRTRARTTKVLEMPLQSQLISQFQGATDLEKDFPTLRRNSSEKRRRLLQRNNNPPAAPSKNIPTKRQDTYEIASSIEGLLPPQSPPEIEFTSVVSPIEGSLGGFTGLQGLPPLSPVQFVKLLVSVTPFIIPLIFIPLLIFTIGLLMIPVTRQNIFLDVGDLRSSSFISNYLVTPITRLGGVLPRSLAYDLGNKLVDTEQCVERISCEISARYLHSTWEPGNWRSIPNTSWISRIMSYLWKRDPTVSRIAKSLEAIGKEDDIMRGGHSPPDSENTVISNISPLSLSNERRRRNGGACGRFTCQPKTLLHNFLSSSSSQSS